MRPTGGFGKGGVRGKRAMHTLPPLFFRRRSSSSGGGKGESIPCIIPGEAEMTFERGTSRGGKIDNVSGLSGGEKGSCLKEGRLARKNTPNQEGG